MARRIKRSKGRVSNRRKTSTRRRSTARRRTNARSQRSQTLRIVVEQSGPATALTMPPNVVPATPRKARF